jgi:anthranilate phosphoribosyltransferase
MVNDDKTTIFSPQKLLSKILCRKDLSYAESINLAESIAKGSLESTFTVAFLIALKMKNEKASEIAGFAKVMRDLCVKIYCGKEAIDTAGTGGDGIGTINASTGAAIICSAAGAKVVKHGNRSASSRSGSADVLEALGFKVALGPKEAESLLRKTGFTFLFAPLYHPMLKNVMRIRRELGVRTIFNIVGPLANPALVRRQIMGVSDRKLCIQIIKAAKILGFEKILVVHGMEGIDEISVSSETLVYEVSSRKIDRYFLQPEDIGLKRWRLLDVLGGDAQTNAELLVGSLKHGAHGAIKDFLLANAGAALYTANIAKNIKDGVEIARQAIEDGLALKKLYEIVELSGSSIAKLKMVLKNDSD